MIKVQYAIIPIKYLEIKNSSDRYDFFYKPKNLIIKVSLDGNPYVEELITKKKIGLNKSDEYKIYLKGDVIYSLCSKEEAYVKVMKMKNYEKEVTTLFMD